MSSVPLWIGVFALLCVAAALVLWHSSTVRDERAHAARFIDSRLTPARAAGSTGAPAASAQQKNATKASRATSNKPRTGFALWREQALNFLLNFSNRVGLDEIRGLLIVALVVIVIGALAMGIATGMLAAGAILIGGGIAIAFWIVARIQKRRAAIVRQLPSFLDGIVLLVTLGNSVPAAFQATLLSTDAPLRGCLDHVSRMLRTGVEIDKAMQHIAELYKIREFELLGSVLRLSVKYGGRADVMLERMSVFMRDLEQAERELVAMTAETRLSAWVLGLLPVGIACFMVATNPEYFGEMWNTASGKHMVYLAFFLQVAGGCWLYRLTRLR